jgi:hypothetical protein
MATERVASEMRKTKYKVSKQNVAQENASMTFDRSQYERADIVPFLVFVLAFPRASHCVLPRESEDHDANVSQRMSEMNRQRASTRGVEENKSNVNINKVHDGGTKV